MSDKERTQGKVEIKIRNLSFTAEGDQEWLGEQLSKVINAAAVSCTAYTRGHPVKSCRSNRESRCRWSAEKCQCLLGILSEIQGRGDKTGSALSSHGGLAER